MKIYFATDHAGFALKEKIKVYVESLGYDIEDLGSKSFNIGDDYTDFIVLAARAVSLNPRDTKAIVFGGSGQGEAMLANRFKNVRATVFYGEPKSGFFGKRDRDSIIALSREHNDANVLSIGARFVGETETKKAVKKWLETSFSKEERHQRRINKIEELTK